MSPEQADAISQPPPEMFGLTDDELAIRRTVFASDALKDMVVVVTGATGGIGRAIAWLFARLGAHIVLVGRNQTKLDVLTARMTQLWRFRHTPPISGSRMLYWRCLTQSGRLGAALIV